MPRKLLAISAPGIRVRRVLRWIEQHAQVEPQLFDLAKYPPELEICFTVYLRIPRSLTRPNG